MEVQVNVLADGGEPVPGKTALPQNSWVDFDA
jgi:hypothetical protein